MIRYCCICKVESGANEDVSIHMDSNTILADVTNTNLQDISYSCVKVAESKNVKVTVHVKTQDNIEQSSSDSIHYDSNNGNTNSAVTEHEFHSEIINDNCNELNIPIDSECSNEKTALKRKSNEPMKGAKRLCNLRYIGDLRREDFTSEISWKIFHEYVKTSKSQCKVLNQKIKRLNKKVETLKSLLDHLKKNDLLSNKACNALEVSY
ncbi:unnamed protein product [Lasius platythorax]|uniref:Uncharacterized protein n=1 Tax=Lasius platythorax TaxID=488582 RepID=A0AAV2MWL9_9HYME